jgi:hypothetical protein
MPSCDLKKTPAALRSWIYHALKSGDVRAMRGIFDFKIDTIVMSQYHKTENLSEIAEISPEIIDLALIDQSIETSIRRDKLALSVPQDSRQ